MKKLKVMTIVGTRPEIIRLSRTMTMLDEYVNQIIVHTGQNYDYELNEIFWEELELHKPDYFLNVDTSSLGTAVGDIICQIHDRGIESLMPGLVMLRFFTTDIELTEPCPIGFNKRLQYPVQYRFIRVKYTLGWHPVIDLDDSFIDQIRFL